MSRKMSKDETNFFRFPGVAPGRYLPIAPNLNTHFMPNSSGILVPMQSAPLHPALRTLGPPSPGQMRKVLLCPTCKIRFPVPQPDPEINFKVSGFIQLELLLKIRPIIFKYEILLKTRIRFLKSKSSITRHHSEQTKE